MREPIDFGQFWSDAVVKDYDGLRIRVARIAHRIEMVELAWRFGATQRAERQIEDDSSSV